MSRKGTDYLHEAEDDARSTLEEFLDQMIEQWKDNHEVSDDLLNDYPSGDSYHHENHVDKAYSLTEAADLLGQLGDYEETDSGLWEGQAPRDAISTQAAYTYGNAVYSLWRDHIERINADLDALEFDSEEELQWFGAVYITAYTVLHNNYQEEDCKGMVGTALSGLEDGDTVPLQILCDYIEEHGDKYKQRIAQQLRAVLAEKPMPKQKFIRFEYDLDYAGGNYSSVGQFALVPLALVEEADEPEEAFVKHTGIDAIHIIHYSLDEVVDEDGDIIDD